MLKIMHLQQRPGHSSEPSLSKCCLNICFAMAEDEWAFDLLYCVAFMLMDKQWLQRNASYMEFNEVLKSTRGQLERELMMDDVIRIEDMPSYNLLG
ncbi:hypothetical protein ZIOFF_058505 [Zingiber officinale]|nr:hypothetical protein ZIOFF_058505 [Zingiber officinale]